VQDDSRGYDPVAATGESGLAGMTKRLTALGGTFEVRTAPGTGTTVTGALPLARDRRRPAPGSRR
jgi:signal transduction histidine kinase